MPKIDGLLAVVGVDVVPMDTREVLRDRTVVIDGRHVVAEGPRASIETSGAQLVDGRGRYLMPGLADMHVHLSSTAECGMFLANGVTTVRNMWGGGFHLAYRRAHADGRLVGPRLVTTSPIVDGVGPGGTTVWPGSYAADNVEGAARLVEQIASRGYPMLKAYSWLRADVLAALGAACREHGLRMVGHCPDVVSYEQAIDAGLTCFEHLTNIGRDHLRAGYAERVAPLQGASNPQRLRLIADGIDLDRIRELADRMAAEQVWNCPTLVVTQRMYLPRDEARADPNVRFEPASLLEAWNPDNDFRLKALDWDDAVDANRHRTRMHRDIVAILYEAGAPLLIGTDTANPNVVQGFAVHQELRNFVASGLSPYDALRCATVEAARFLGEDDWGRIRVGQRADLLLLDSDPLVDVGAVRVPREVYTNGSRLERGDLDRLLDDRLQLVSGRSALPAVDLPGLDDAHETIDEGVLDHSLAAQPVGRVAFRCCAVPDGRRVVDERLVDPETVTHGRVWITAAGRVERATRTTACEVGEQRLEATWDTEGGYQVVHTDYDGVTTTGWLAGDPVVPAGELSLTAMSFVQDAHLAATGLATIGRAGQDYRRTPVTVDGLDGDRVVGVVYPADKALRRYHTQAGRLASVTEPTWQGQRAIVDPAADLPDGAPTVDGGRTAR